MTMPKNRIWILTVCCAAVGLFGSSAQAQDTHFKIYGGPAYVAPTSESDITLGTINNSIQAEKQVGWNLGIEGRFTHWIGLEVDYVNANQDVNFNGGTIGDVNFSPLTATFDIHVVHTKVVDFYLGPSYTYVNWGDIHLNTTGQTFPEFTGSSEVGTDSAKGWGASLGLDIGLGEHFAITGGLKYLNVDLELQNSPAVKMDPLLARLGVAVRF
jgi:outer membrane protein W